MPGRIDIAIVRTSDATGVAGTGLLAAIVFDAVGGGAANLTVTGTATAPGGAPASLQVAPVAQVTRKLGVSEKTYYLWKKQYAHLLTNELRELRQLREENAKLKRLVADLTLDKVMLQEVLTKKE